MIRVKIVYLSPGVIDPKTPPKYPRSPGTDLPCGLICEDTNGERYYSPSWIDYLVKYKVRLPRLSTPFGCTARQGMDVDIEFQEIRGEKIITEAKLVGVKEER